MPTPTPKPAAAIDRDGNTLRLRGVLAADAVARLRLDRQNVAGVTQISLDEVERVDTVGVALIAQLVAAAAAASGARPHVSGRPAGLEELCQAYRIDPDFSDFP